MLNDRRLLWSVFALTFGLGGCLAPQSVKLPNTVSPVKGSVELSRSIQATMGEATQGATVSLIDAATGNTVASSITDAGGAFVLSFPGVSPANGSVYMLEAVKGLSVGSTANRAGAQAVRLRSYLFWNSGWQSMTNTAVNSGIIVGNSTTALSAIVSLRQQAGASLTLSNLIGKVNETADTFTEAGTGLTNAADFVPVLPLVGSAITLDQDPLSAIAYNRVNGTYALSTGVPWISGTSPTATPGGNLTIRGANLDKLNGRNIFWFGNVPASTWSVSADRTTATVAVPASAISAPLFLQQPDGAFQTITPLLRLRGTVGTLIGNGIAGIQDGPAHAAPAEFPGAFALDSNGTLYYTEYYRHLIRKISPNGLVTTLAGAGVAGDSDGTGTAAQFNQPQCMTLDASGNLYVVETARGRIRKVTPGGVVTTLAGATDGSTGEGDGVGTVARFTNPLQIFYKDGMLYTVEYTSKRIRRISLAGAVTTLTVGGGFTANPASPLVLSAMGQPEGIVLDSQGNLFVGDDTAPYRLIKIVPTTGVTSTFAGDGTGGYLDSTNPLTAEFNGCHDLIIDGSDNLYFSDPHSTNLIRKITPSGVVTSFGSVRSATAFADGPFSAAKFSNIGAIIMDPNGAFYVCDGENKRIRVVTP